MRDMCIFACTFTRKKNAPDNIVKNRLFLDFRRQKGQKGNEKKGKIKKNEKKTKKNTFSA